MNAVDQGELRRKIAALRVEHRALDAEIDAAMAATPADAIMLQRLKKKKLALRDRIASLEDHLFPDIIA